MSHFTRGPELHKQKTVSHAQAKLPIKLRLAEASTQEEVNTIVQETFFAKVLALFQLDDYNSSGSSLECLHLNQLGIDSLSAVEIRSWFMKNFEVNIPVLKILDGVTVGNWLLSLSREFRLDWSLICAPAYHSRTRNRNFPHMTNEELLMRLKAMGMIPLPALK